MRNREGRYYQVPNAQFEDKKYNPNKEKFQKSGSSLMPINQTCPHKDICNGFVKVGNPTRPKYKSGGPSGRKSYTSASDHWTPLGPHNTVAQSYLAGTKRRPGGSIGAGHHKK